MVSVLIRGRLPKVTGGKQTNLLIETAEQWCDYYGVAVTDGIATLYKALNDNWTSPCGTSYAPGETPEAPDWDGGEAECGGGLHFSPHPIMALEFHAVAKRFAACPVALSDIAIHPDGEYPQKVKARRCCGPCYAVDLNGQRIEETTPAASQ